MGMNQNQINILCLSKVFFSTCSSIISKWQQKQVVDGHKFVHPFMQSLQMFIGETLCFLVFLAYKKKFADRYEQGRQVAVAKGASDKINYLIFSFPTMCDFITSTISFFAINMMPLSINLMIKGGNIIVTAIFSIIFLKKILYNHHYLGLGLAIAGSVFMGVMSMLNTNNSDDDQTQMLIGILLTVFSFFTFATQMVVEEKFFSQYYLHPFQGVGIEGFWGIGITAIAISIFNFIPVPNNFPAPPNGNMEDFPNFMYQVFSMESLILFFTFFAYIIVILFVNGLALTVTKYASCIVRSLLNITSPFLVWAFCLAVQWESFQWFQLVAYIFITCGTLIYNETIEIPLLGFNKNLKKYINKKDDEEPFLDQDNNLVPQHPYSSFHKHSDQIDSNYSES
ncbi:hypothetical protein ABPG74_012287 [Tetrahymena malaccensis]